VVGAVFGPRGHVFTWTVVDPGDTFVFLGQMARGARGHWEFVNLYTYRSLAGQPLYLFYSALGHLVPGWAFGPTGLGLVYQGARLAISALTLWEGWLLMKEMCPSRASRRAAFVLAFFTAGLGFYELAVPALRVTPRGLFDLYFDESNTFAGLLSVPHHAAVLLLLIVYLRAMLRLLRSGRGSWPAALTATTAAALLSLIHPDKAVITALATLFALAWTAAAKGLPSVVWWQGLTAALGGAPYALLLVFLFRGSAALTQLASSATTQTEQLLNPNPLFYLLGFGIPGALALSGLPLTPARMRRASPAEVAGWSVVLAAVVVALLPSGAVQHRLEGVQMVLAPLAARQLVRRILPRAWRSAWFARVAAARPFGYSRRRLRVLSINLPILASTPTVLLVLASFSAGTLVGARDLYLRPGEAEAMAWLAGHASAEQVVVATPPTARFITAYAGTHVAFGNSTLTPDYDREQEQSVRFFTSPGYDREEYLRLRSVAFLYFGPLEREAAVFAPSTKPYLELVYSREGVEIYRVRTGA
jgi:hypothetical protein